jgi:spore coat polysaccharide biosynthesis protein SpsF
MTSTRLPGKVMHTVKGKPLLHYHIERLLKTGIEIAIATTTNKEDDCIADFAQKNNIKIHRGSEKNVLSRYFEAAKKFHFDVVVRVTSDCPLIDPSLIKEGVEKYLEMDNPNMYMSNCIERTFARGFDFEIFSFRSLTEAFYNATAESELEHVTPYIRENNSGSIVNYSIRQPDDNGSLRVTVDTPEDLELIRQLIEIYNADNLPYSEIEKLLIAHPELSAINAQIIQKKD